MQKVETGCSDMELIMDMLCDGNTDVHDDIIDEGQPPSYYEGKAIHILKQLDDTDNYFYFLKAILKNYEKLEEPRKKAIIEMLNIKPEVIIKEKIINPKKKSKNNKPKLNTSDEY